MSDFKVSTHPIAGYNAMKETVTIRPQVTTDPYTPPTFDSIGQRRYIDIKTNSEPSFSNSVTSPNHKIDILV